MKKSRNNIFKILLLPLIVALLTTLSIQFIEENSDSALIRFTMFENLMFFVLPFLAIYLFIIIFVVPIDLYLIKQLQNKITYFILFNLIGLALVSCINIWILGNYGLNSLFLIFPFVSLLSTIEWNSDTKSV